jgi:hypothetical protein
MDEDTESGQPRGATSPVNRPGPEGLKLTQIQPVEYSPESEEEESQRSSPARSSAALALASMFHQGTGECTSSP